MPGVDLKASVALPVKVPPLRSKVTIATSSCFLSVPMAEKVISTIRSSSGRSTSVSSSRKPVYLKSPASNTLPARNPGRLKAMWVATKISAFPKSSFESISEVSLWVGIDSQRCTHSVLNPNTC